MCGLSALNPLLCFIEEIEILRKKDLVKNALESRSGEHARKNAKCIVRSTESLNDVGFEVQEKKFCLFFLLTTPSVQWAGDEYIVCSFCQSLHDRKPPESLKILCLPQAHHSQPHCACSLSTRGSGQ